MPFSNRPYESDGNGAVRRFFRPPSTDYKRSPRNNSRPAKPAPPEVTNAESFYYTKQMNARTPMVISLVSIAVNYVINSLLVGPFGHVGLAFSTSAVALVNFILLAFFMHRRVGRLEGNRLGRTLLRIFVASVPMAVVAWSVNEFCASMPLSGIVLKLVSVVAAITLAAIVFYAGCRMLRVEELDEAIDAVGGRFRRVLRRK